MSTRISISQSTKAFDVVYLLNSVAFYLSDLTKAEATNALREVAKV